MFNGSFQNLEIIYHIWLGFSGLSVYGGGLVLMVYGGLV